MLAVENRKKDTSSDSSQTPKSDATAILTESKDILNTFMVTPPVREALVAGTNHMRTSNFSGITQQAAEGEALLRQVAMDYNFSPGDVANAVGLEWHYAVSVGAGQEKDTPAFSWFNATSQELKAAQATANGNRMADVFASQQALEMAQGVCNGSADAVARANASASASGIALQISEGLDVQIIGLLATTQDRLRHGHPPALTSQVISQSSTLDNTFRRIKNFVHHAVEAEALTVQESDPYKYSATWAV